jgi:hypothetical protein
LLQNRQGRTRLAKYYVPLDDNEKRKLEFDIHRLVVNRDPKFTNFLEARPPVSSRALTAQRSAGCRGCCAAHALCCMHWRCRVRRARGAARGARTPAFCVNPKARACLNTRSSARTRSSTAATPACSSPCVWTPQARAGRGRTSALHADARSHALFRAENELSCLEAIHLFVEILDTYFSHVCELDLVWHFHKVRSHAARPRTTRAR